MAAIGDETGVMELNGLIDEFYIYTKALTRPEILNLAQACEYGELNMLLHFLWSIVFFL